MGRGVQKGGGVRGRGGSVAAAPPPPPLISTVGKFCAQEAIFSAVFGIFWPSLVYSHFFYRHISNSCWLIQGVKHFPTFVPIHATVPHLPILRYVHALLLR